MERSVGVYCSSSNRIDEHYLALARRLGSLLAHAGFRLVYGGGNRSMMGALARAVHASGGTVIGVIPEALKKIEGVAYDVADELIITDTMSERKAIIYATADAFIALPGGFGTLEEFMEVLTLKQLGYHTKAIVLVNHEGHYDPLLSIFEHYVAHGFARPSVETLFEVVETPEEAVAYISASA